MVISGNYRHDIITEMCIEYTYICIIICVLVESLNMLYSNPSVKIKRCTMQ